MRNLGASHIINPLEAEYFSRVALNLNLAGFYASVPRVTDQTLEESGFLLQVLSPMFLLKCWMPIFPLLSVFKDCHFLLKLWFGEQCKCLVVEFLLYFICRQAGWWRGEYWHGEEGLYISVGWLCAPRKWMGHILSSPCLEDCFPVILPLNMSYSHDITENHGILFVWGAQIAMSICMK